MRYFSHITVWAIFMVIEIFKFLELPPEATGHLVTFDPEVLVLFRGTVPKSWFEPPGHCKSGYD